MFYSVFRTFAPGTRAVFDSILGTKPGIPVATDALLLFNILCRLRLKWRKGF